MSKRNRNKVIIIKAKTYPWYAYVLLGIVMIVGFMWYRGYTFNSIKNNAKGFISSKTNVNGVTDPHLKEILR